MLDRFIFKDPALVHCQNIKRFSEHPRDISYFKGVNLCTLPCGITTALNIKMTSGDQLRLNYVSGASEIEWFHFRTSQKLAVI